MRRIARDLRVGAMSLAAYARNTRAALLRHPWAIDSFNNGPPSGPNDARNAEGLLGAARPSAVRVVA
jgi:hypothetical protein